MVTAADWLEGEAEESGCEPAGPGWVAASWLGVALRRVTRLLGSGRSSVVSHQGTAWRFMPSRMKPGVRGGASPFIISWWKLPTGWTCPRGKG